MKKIEILRRKVPAIAILISLLVIGTASAALFMNYATLSGTFDVEGNGISVSDHDTDPIAIGGSGELIFESPATFTINNNGDEPVIVDLVTTLYLDDVLVTDEEGLTVDYSVLEDTGVESGLVLVPPGGLTVEVNHSFVENVMPGTYTVQVEVKYINEDYETFIGANAMEYLELSSKNTDWTPSTDKVDILFAPKGNEFYYELSSIDVVADREYALIYYADFGGNRFGEWGGNNPGVVIDIRTADNVGSISMSGSNELNMNLPCIPDANIDEHDYSGYPDYYLNAHGAKLWLVPTSDLTEGIALPVLPLEDWIPEGIFFETDLIQYTDTDA